MQLLLALNNYTSWLQAHARNNELGSQRSKARHLNSIGSTCLALFASEAKEGDFPLVMHFDGKQLTQDFGGRKETLPREMLVVTSLCT